MFAAWGETRRGGIPCQGDMAQSMTGQHGGDFGTGGFENPRRFGTGGGLQPEGEVLGSCLDDLALTQALNFVQGGTQREGCY